ncbi:MAG: YidC/Oxa1 family insertase periplasmic-domain containing protein [Gemmataceae bacterium]
MNRHTVFNVALFVTLAVTVGAVWWWVEKTYFPKPEPTPEAVKPTREQLLAVAGGAVAPSDEAAKLRSRYVPEQPTAEKPAEPPKPVEPPKPATPSESFRLIALGGDGFNKRVLLSSKGAGIQQVVLPAFDQASRLGREVRDAGGNPRPLELIPGYIRKRDSNTVTNDGEYLTLVPTAAGKTVDPALALALAEPSYTLFHYPAAGDPDRWPEDKDGKTHEKYPSRELGTRTWKVVEEVPGTDTTDARVVFETTLGEPYHLTLKKTFELAKRDYHVRMKLEIIGLDARSKDARTRAPFKYQIAGGHGLPVEGEWYTGTFRNAQVGWKTKSGVGKRAFQDAATITGQHGGDSMASGGFEYTYAAVSTQYFATALAVDPDSPAEQKADNLWEYVRATREASPGVPEDKPQMGDITVRAVSKPVNPDPGQAVEHRYWVYDGPIKVRLLKHLDQLPADRRQYAADPATVDRYLDALTLYTLTDAPTPNALGTFADSIYWTDLVVFFTNLMHGVLGWLHHVVPVWGVDIILLTFLVRLILLVPSRRQQGSMLKLQDKMAALKPEIDKLAERYKGDPQRLNQEKTRLMIQSGVNPLASMGGCLLMFAQMPVFMGLYFCLQESVFFRLDRFLWVDNLAAPDMLVWWSEKIWFLSTPDSVGGMLYLGPYLNLLPIAAVTLMFINMKVSTPPPADEQQEMQQKTMKYMMIFMGVFFYKMAAGMCVYFIVSTTWGLIERKLLKKKKPNATLAPEPAPVLITDPGPVPAAPTGRLGRFKQRLLDAMEEAQKRADTPRQIVNNPPKPGDNGKKKRRRK